MKLAGTGFQTSQTSEPMVCVKIVCEISLACAKYRSSSIYNLYWLESCTPAEPEHRAFHTEKVIDDVVEGAPWPEPRLAACMHACMHMIQPGKWTCFRFRRIGLERASA